MRQTIFPLVAVALLSSSAHAKDTLEYFDILGAEVVGELDRQTYDEKIDKRFVGTRDVAGLLVGGGIGLRPVFVLPDGLRFSIEVSGTWGRLRDADPGVAYSTMSRLEWLTGIGYELHVGKILALHTASLVGLDAAWVNRAQQIQLFDASTNQAAPAMASSSLSRIDLRLGQQLGAHVQLGKELALYADGTIDYDGQWRVRAGIAIGEILKR
ncbi:MAG TPA: hypothetical protein VF997_00185 [Polyangia bacterium]